MYNAYQPYFGQQNMNRYQQPMEQPILNQSYIPQTPVTKPTGLLGKMVDSIDMAKSVDYVLDGSQNIFPLLDGSAIVTKQLQSDGTSKITIYKPVEDKENYSPKYVTLEELKEEISNIDIPDVDELIDDIKEIKKDIKNLKGKSN